MTPRLDVLQASWVRRTTDVLLVAAPAALLALVAGHELSYNHAGARTWVLVMSIIWPLLLRRRAPVLVLGASWAFALTVWATDVATLADFALLVALYTVADRRDFRWAAASAAALEVGVVLVAVRFGPVGSVNDALVLLTGLVAAALFLGTTVRSKRAQLASAEERAATLERERVQQAELAASAERTRIAREMHDIVAHGLSVVITLAEGAAATTDVDPPRAKESMLQVAETGRESLAEMRRLLGVLRTGAESDVASQPQPGLAELGDLLASVRRTGIAVDLVTTGAPDQLSPAAGTTLYRVVQESLTNVLKHARGASAATVRLDYQPSLVRFAIRDDGRHADGRPASSGRGILGMSERVAMFDGRLESGPSDDGWTVRGELRL